MNRMGSRLLAFGLLVFTTPLIAQEAIQYVSPATGLPMKIEPVPPPPSGKTIGQPTAEEPPRAIVPEESPQPFVVQTLQPSATKQVVEPAQPAQPAAAGRAEPQEQGSANQPAVANTGPALNVPQAMYYYTPDYWVNPRFTVRRSFGDGVGYDNGYTYLEGFAPFLQDAGSSLMFGNARAVNYDNADFWEFQFGGGGRRVINDSLVAGVNGFYDGRNTNFNYFHQLGLGFEALGPVWEWRGNVYIPIGPQRAAAGGSGFFNPQFVATNISLDRFLFFETALNGIDTEVGRSLIVNDRLNLRGYVGYYHYSNDGVPTANGIRGRLEAWVTENLSFNLAVQNDAVFDTTVTGGLAMHLGGLPRGVRQTAPLQSKLGNRVVRDPNIVIQRTQQFSRELAIDPVTNAPIEVRHVNSNAAAGGDGSVERPFQTLTQLQNGSGPRMILFAHSGSVFNGEGIALQDSQRFLGEGIPFLFTATQGTFLLPTATGGHIQPIINNAPGNAVVLASNNEVANFGINSAGLNAIRGVGINNFNLHDLNINGSGLNGIYLTSVTGTGLILNNSIINNGRGADVTLAGVLPVALGGDSTGNGILIESSNFAGSIANNTITGNGVGGAGTANSAGFASAAFAAGGDGNGSGIAFQGTTYTGDISNNVISGNGSGGTATATSDSVFAANAGAAGDGNGSGILVSQGSQLNGPITNNTITGNGVGAASSASTDTFVLGAAASVGGDGNGSGIRVTDAGSGINGPISGNNISGNGIGGAATAQSNAFINANVALGGDGAGSGIDLSANTINGDITSNTINGNGIGGAATAMSTAGFISANAALAGDAAGSGISANGATINGSISGNVINGNANGGAANAVSSGIFSAAFALGGDGIGTGISIINSVFNGGITNNSLNNNGVGGNASATAGVSAAIGGSGNGNPSGIDTTGTAPTGGISGNSGTGNGVDGTP